MLRKNCYYAKKHSLSGSDVQGKQSKLKRRSGKRFLMFLVRFVYQKCKYFSEGGKGKENLPVTVRDAPSLLETSQFTKHTHNLLVLFSNFDITHTKPSLRH